MGPIQYPGPRALEWKTTFQVLIHPRAVFFDRIRIHLSGSNTYGGGPFSGPRRRTGRPSQDGPLVLLCLSQGPGARAPMDPGERGTRARAAEAVPGRWGHTPQRGFLWGNRAMGAIPYERGSVGYAGEGMVPGARIELATFRLRIGCTTAVLARPAAGHTPDAPKSPAPPGPRNANGGR